jgi:hypothetical protein
MKTCNLAGRISSEMTKHPTGCARARVREPALQTVILVSDPIHQFLAPTGVARKASGQGEPSDSSCSTPASRAASVMFISGRPAGFLRGELELGPREWKRLRQLSANARSACHRVCGSSLGGPPTSTAGSPAPLSVSGLSTGASR